jgi:predicted metal-dependent phosphoesterase TrpH
MIDLHSHTTASDGTLAPDELVALAVERGLEALAITDHDTLAGYDEAAPHAARRKLDLLCGIELSTKYNRRTVHLLGYFPGGAPGAAFRSWLDDVQQSRHRRNLALIRKAREAGFDISLEEWYQKGGGLPGRPHLAALLLEKGYVSSLQEAFDRYLAESGALFTERVEPKFEECTARLAQAGGLPVLAHPGRVTRDPAVLEKLVAGMREDGLRGIEVHHSDHTPADRAVCEALAARYALAVTGGSDFHGANKPDIQLGTGLNGNVRVPREVLDTLRSLV